MEDTGPPAGRVGALASLERDDVGRRWLRLRNFLTHKVLHTDDTPHAVGLGAAIATFVAFLPLIGFQTIIAISLAAVARANKAVCVPVVWITNPFSAVPIYGACLGLGRWVVSSPRAAKTPAMLAQIEQHRRAGLFSLEYWWAVFQRLISVGAELWVGCLIVGLLCAIPAYFVARRGVSVYRERRRKRLLHRQLLRSAIAGRRYVRPTDPL